MKMKKTCKSVQEQQGMITEIYILLFKTPKFMLMNFNSTLEKKPNV